MPASNKADLPRLAVLGAGPIGLEAALYARSLGYPAALYEKGRLAEHLQRWGHIRMFSPFGMNSTPLGKAAIRAENPKHVFPAETDVLTGAEHFAAYLEPLALSGKLIETLQLDSQVVAVGRAGLSKHDLAAKRGERPFRILLRNAKGEERCAEADIVLDCTGTYARPRWLGEGGIPAPGETAARPLCATGIEDVLGKERVRYASKTVLVVGGGYSAATNVCLLADLAAGHQDMWIIWLVRAPRSAPLLRHPHDPLRERERLAARANMLATRGEGNVEYHASSVVESLVSQGPDKGFLVTARLGTRRKSWEVDRVIANVGTMPDDSLFRELQVQLCPATEAPVALAAALRAHPCDLTALPSLPAACLRTTEPNFFILGAKSFGRSSHFLLQTGFDQVRDLFTLITGRPELNLHTHR